MGKYNYYRDELSKLKETEYYPTIQIRDGNGNNTKWLALNEESIPIIIDYLSKLISDKKDEEMTVSDILSLSENSVGINQYNRLRMSKHIVKISMLGYEIEGVGVAHEIIFNNGEKRDSIIIYL